MVLTQMTVLAPVDEIRLSTELRMVLAVFACSFAKPLWTQISDETPGKSPPSRFFVKMSISVRSDRLVWHPLACVPNSRSVCLTTESGLCPRAQR